MSATRHLPQKASGKLRAACDACHLAKSKCSRGLPCAECHQSGARCSYSPPNQLGRPKGSKSKARGKGHAESSGTAEVSTSALRSPDTSSNPHNILLAGSEAFLQSNGVLSSTTLTNQANNVGTDLESKSMWDEATNVPGGETMDGNPLSSHHGLVAEFQTPSSQWGTDTEMDLSYEALHGVLGLGTSPLSLQSHAAMRESNLCHASGVCSPLKVPADFGSERCCGASLLGPKDSTPGNGETTSPETAPLNSASSDLSSTSQLRFDTSARVRSHCLCVQKHIELLYQLQPAVSDVSGLPAESFLNVARRVLEYWNRLLLCPNCRLNKEQGAWLLSATTLRLVISRVISTREGESNHDMSQSLPPRILVGNFDVTGEDHQAVVKLLTQKFLERLQQALNFIKRCIDEQIPENLISSASDSLTEVA